MKNHWQLQKFNKLSLKNFLSEYFLRGEIVYISNAKNSIPRTSFYITMYILNI